MAKMNFKYSTMNAGKTLDLIRFETKNRYKRRKLYCI